MSGSCGAGKGGGRGSGRAVAEPTGGTLRRDPVGRESPARDAQRERDAEPRRLRVRLQAHRTTGLQGGDRLIVKTDPQLNRLIVPAGPVRRGTPHGRSGQTQSVPQMSFIARADRTRAESC